MAAGDRQPNLKQQPIGEGVRVAPLQQYIAPIVEAVSDQAIEMVTDQALETPGSASERPAREHAPEALPATNERAHTAPEVEQDDAESNTRQADVQIHVNDDPNARPNTRQIHVNPVSVEIESAFGYEAQLYRLEVYTDKYGRTIVKRTVRFVARRTGKNIGEITPELAEALKRRPGKGRTAEARAEADRSRFLAESLAKRLRRVKTSRRSNASHSRDRRERGDLHASSFGRDELLSDVRDVSQHETGAYLH